jgi:ferric-dicitrate binding protein FerR (iron transport regulator)
MSGKALNDSTLKRLSTAAKWLQRLHDAPEDESLQARCRHWRESTPCNASAFERMQAIWQAFDSLSLSSRAIAELACQAAFSGARGTMLPVDNPTAVASAERGNAAREI